LAPKENNLKEENVVLVNENDEQIGLMPKMEAHEKAVLHRAFSIFVMNDKGETMLQQRAAHKYHSPLLWTNTCCSHQRDGENNIDAGQRRLAEEMGFVTELEELMIGSYNEDPFVNSEEVADWKWMKPAAIKEDIANHPDSYTAWFKIIFERFYEHLTQNISR